MKQNKDILFNLKHRFQKFQLFYSYANCCINAGKHSRGQPITCLVVNDHQELEAKMPAFHKLYSEMI